MSADQDWVRQLKQGDETAKNRLWQFLHHRRLIYLQYNRGDEETLSEATVQAYNNIMDKGIQQYRGDGSFEGYCHRTFENAVRSLQRKQNKQREQPLSETEHTNDEADPPATFNLMMTRLQPCLDKLNDRQRQIFALLLERVGTAVGAEQLNIQRNHFSVLTHRLREALQKCLDGRGFATADEFGSF